MSSNFKKKILIFSPDIPRLNAKGYQSLVYHRLKAYKKNGYEVRIICFCLKKFSSDEESIKELSKIGVKVYYYYVSKLLALYNIFFGYFSNKIPFQTLIYKSPQLQRNITNLLNSFKPDLIHIITIRMANSINTYKKPIIIDFVDSMYLNFSERLKSSNLLTSFLIRRELNRLKLFEKKIADLSHKSFVVANKDLEAINSKNIIALPIALDLKFIVKKNKEVSKNQIIFTGNMDYFPNIEAVNWFYKNCWKIIKNKIPSCKLYIVGRNPTSRILRIISNDKNVFVTGEVESIFNYIINSSVAIAPMQSGSGMQNKIVEAMAVKIPVITTHLGLGDIKAKDGKNIIVASTPELFAKKVIYLLKDQDLREKIGCEGQKYVFKNHDMLKINKDFINIIKSVLDKQIN